jgi:hypothetical protein
MSLIRNLHGTRRRILADAEMEKNRRENEDPEEENLDCEAAEDDIGARAEGRSIELREDSTACKSRLRQQFIFRSQW